MINKLTHIILPIITTIFFVVIVGSIVFLGATPQTYNCSGIVEGWSIPVIGNNIVGTLVNSGIILLTATLLTKIATHYQLVKEQTLLPLLFFLLFLSLTSTLINHFEPVNILSLIVFVLVAILYSSYQENRSTEKGFIIALIVSVISFVDAHILYLLPILIVGIIQMQAASLRTFAAMIVGLLTPYWIVWGFGWIELSQLDFTTLAISLQIPPIDIQLIPVAAIMFIGFVCGISNLYNAFNEKIYTRATNGFINLLSTYTALLLIIDNANYIQYLPILCGCVALQTSYFFTTRTKRTHTIVLIVLVTLIMTWIGWMYWGNYPYI